MIADKFTQYELTVPDQPRDKPQPRCILLESQLESLKHHFLHWNLSAPTVKFHVSKRTLYSCSYIDMQLCRYKQFLLNFIANAKL